MQDETEAGELQKSWSNFFIRAATGHSSNLNLAVDLAGGPPKANWSVVSVKSEPADKRNKIADVGHEKRDYTGPKYGFLPLNRQELESFKHSYCVELRYTGPRRRLAYPFFPGEGYNTAATDRLPTGAAAVVVFDA